MSSVTLTNNELLMASTVGAMRQIAAIKRGFPDRHGYNGDGWSIHIEGACGELAVAKTLGVYWDGSINKFQSPDVGSLYVRTRSRDDYDLIVRANDPDHAIYVLVTGRAPTYEVRGWIQGMDAKTPMWLASHGGREEAWFVPAGALSAIETMSYQMAA